MEIKLTSLPPSLSFLLFFLLIILNDLLRFNEPLQIDLVSNMRRRALGECSDREKDMGVLLRLPNQPIKIEDRASFVGATGLTHHRPMRFLLNSYCVYPLQLTQCLELISIMLAR